MLHEFLVWVSDVGCVFRCLILHISYSRIQGHKYDQTKQVHFKFYLSTSMIKKERGKNLKLTIKKNTTPKKQHKVELTKIVHLIHQLKFINLEKD